MTAFITIIHVITCLILIVAVLLQSGKSADLAGAFGGGGSQSAFGPRGGQTILSQMTTISAVLFMFTSMGLWLMSSQESGSVLQGETAPVTQKAEPVDEKAAADVQTPEKKAADAQQTEQKPPEKAPVKKEGETTPPVKK